MAPGARELDKFRTQQGLKQHFRTHNSQNSCSRSLARRENRSVQLLSFSHYPWKQSAGLSGPERSKNLSSVCEEPPGILPGGKRKICRSQSNPQKSFTSKEGLEGPSLYFTHQPLQLHVSLFTQSELSELFCAQIRQMMDLSAAVSCSAGLNPFVPKSWVTVYVSAHVNHNHKLHWERRNDKKHSSHVLLSTFILFSHNSGSQDLRVDSCRGCYHHSFSMQGRLLCGRLHGGPCRCASQQHSSTAAMWSGFNREPAGLRTPRFPVALNVRRLQFWSMWRLHPRQPTEEEARQMLTRSRRGLQQPMLAFQLWYHKDAPFKNLLSVIRTLLQSNFRVCFSDVTRFKQTFL